jgi:CRISPR-associated protein Csm4
MAENTYIVRLFFSNTLHVGSPRSGAGVELSLDFIHSDTLWAAIANYWAIIGSANGISFKNFLDGFAAGKDDEPTQPSKAPLFTLSSAFPFSVEGRNSRYWLPKPLSVSFGLSQLNKPENRNSERKQYSKTLKSSRFILRENFTYWQEFTRRMGHNVYQQADLPGDDAVRPQAAIDRLSNSAHLFHSALTYMEPVSDREGLYFLFRTTDDKVVDALETVLQVISDVGGIGGDISSGPGELRSFTIRQIQDDDASWACLRGPAEPNAYCLLSLCVPSAMEHSSDRYAAYDTVIRKGWTGSLSTTMQKKRKTVHMLSEGSVIVGKEPGRLVTLTPDPNVTPEWQGLHDVYRYGFAFLVPIRINLND